MKTFNIISLGDDEYEILDPVDEQLCFGDAESTSAYANGFNDYVRVAIKHLKPEIDNINAGM
jgi:hypothetical protein